MAEEEKVAKVEARVDKVETEVVELKNGHTALKEKQVETDHKVELIDLQVKRLTSHLESEVSLARRDISTVEANLTDRVGGVNSGVERVERRLFGDADDEYGGRIGQLGRRVYRMEVWLLAIATSAVILGFMFGAYQFIQMVRSKP